MQKALKTHGRLWLENDKWHLECAPHVAMWAKRIFQRIPTDAYGVYQLSHVPSVCRDLEWFSQRFPLQIDNVKELRSAAKAHRDHIARLDQIIDANYEPKSYQLAIPPRDYQRRAADLYLSQRSLLLADEVGLGKTVSSLCSLTDDQTVPAIVVCMPHLQKQWLNEIKSFLPDVQAHIIKTKKIYELPKVDGRGPDVVIISYHKLNDWAEVLSEYGRSIIFDEIQELRRQGTLKYSGAKQIAHQDHMHRIGLSATPIYNYGGEIFSVMEILFPGVLGTEDEFIREWCSYGYDKARLINPASFGTWLRENHYMLRRTRKDVNRELEPLMRITQPIDCDTAPLEDIKDAAGELARIILSQEKQIAGNKMHATEEFNVILRQATGIAKAPHVASFVNMLLENGEKVVLYGWHRAVYNIWLSKLKDHNPQLYTGSESVTQKQKSAEAFINGESDLLIISLRSGAGLDGLQKVCRTVVFGELDWSPGVHEQDVGRVLRDGQSDPVTAYFLLSEGGVDPLMAETLGLKREQIDGVRGESGGIVQRASSGEGLKDLARKYLGTKGE